MVATPTAKGAWCPEVHAQHSYYPGNKTSFSLAGSQYP